MLSRERRNWFGCVWSGSQRQGIWEKLREVDFSVCWRRPSNGSSYFSALLRGIEIFQEKSLAFQLGDPMFHKIQQQWSQNVLFQTLDTWIGSSAVAVTSGKLLRFCIHCKTLLWGLNSTLIMPSIYRAPHKCLSIKKNNWKEKTISPGLGFVFLSSGPSLKNSRMCGRRVECPQLRFSEVEGVSSPTSGGFLEKWLQISQWVDAWTSFGFAPLRL